MYVFMQYGVAGEVKGEAQVVGYENWIEIESVSFGSDEHSATSTGTQVKRPSPTPVVTVISATKTPGRSTPALMRESFGGHPKTVTIHILKLGPAGSPQLYLSIVLSQTRITVQNQVGGDGSFGREVIFLTFSKLQAYQTLWDDLGGSVRVPVSAAFLLTQPTLWE